MTPFYGISLADEYNESRKSAQDFITPTQSGTKMMLMDRHSSSDDARFGGNEA